MDTVFGMFRAAPETSPHAQVLRLDARPRDGAPGWTLYAFDQPMYSVAGENQLVPATESLVTHLFARMQRSLFVLHAGMVAWDGRAVLLPGERGSGKSTLTLWLSRNGARYFGDDLLLVDFHNDEILAFPKAVTLKQGSFGCFEEVPTHQDPMRGPVRYFLPDSAGLHRLPLSSLKWIVFPQYVSAGAGPPRELNQGWTALALVQQLFGGFEWDDAALPLIARLANVPATVLPYTDLDAAEAFLRSKLGATCP